LHKHHHVNNAVRKFLSKAFACLLALSLISAFVFMMQPFAAGAAQTSHVRVLLTAFQTTNQLKIGIFGSYTLNENISFQRGSELIISIVDRKLKVSYEGMAFFPGERIRLVRHAAKAGEENGLRLQDNLSLYEGDLQLTTQGEHLLPILTIPLEQYLKGVVPYEMADDFPLEALKAQAVAARTYTLAHLKPDNAYDLVDNTNDQVFRGLNPDKVNAIMAVEQTAGVVSLYQGKLANTYYTASNGGWTESAFNAWGRERIPYLQIQQDKYDVENPASIVRRARIAKTNEPDAQEPSRLLYARLQELVDQHLQSQGTEPNQARVTGISGMTPHTTIHGGEAGVMKLLKINLTAETTRQVAISQDEEVSLAEQEDASSTTKDGNTVYETRTSVSDLSVDLPIFPDLETLLSLSINRYENELINVEPVEGGFEVQSRRYGHGVGMSQRGAEWMASHYGMDYRQILAFYYPGTVLAQRETAAPPLQALSHSFLTTPGPVPTATPRPTLMPQSAQPGAGQRLVYVSGVAQNSSLNLRAQPDLLADIITRLYFGQQLLVLGSTEDGWLEVKTDAVQGFVRHEYVSEQAP